MAFVMLVVALMQKRDCEGTIKEITDLLRAICLGNCFVKKNIILGRKL